MDKLAILCVDDEQAILESLKAELKQGLDGSYQIETAENASEALELLDELLRAGYRVPVVIADYIMPNMKGDELLRRVHAMSPDTHNIMLTGHATLEAMGYAIRYANLYRYIDKPLDINDLHLTIREALTSYFQAQRLRQFYADLEQQVQLRTQELHEKNAALEQEIIERARTEAALRRSEANLAQAHAIAKLGSFRFSLKTHEVIWSRELCQVASMVELGCMRQECRMSLSEIRKLLHPDDLELMNEAIQRILTGESYLDFDVRVRRPLGRLLHLHCQMEGVYDHTGQVVELFGTLQDISERKQVEAELRQAKQHAEQANAAKSLFLANMSHEIRTPMHAVLGFAELLEDEARTPTAREYLDAIQISARSLLALINDILDLSRVEAGKLVLQYRPTWVLRLFQEMTQIFYQKIQHKSLAFSLDIMPGLPEILSLDETRLRQVLLNLIGNAVKFTDSGSINLAVRYTLHNPTHLDLMIAVTDTGPGIPLDQQETVFHMFEQVQRSTPMPEGTGLGLAISRKLVEMMNGTISLRSEPGQGSCFTVILRNLEVITTPSPAHLEQAAEEISPGQLQFAPVTLLIADDVPFNRILLQKYLSGYGFRILEACDGAEAVALALAETPALVLMDMRMPVLDGYQATQALKNNPKTQHIPVIAITASAMKESEEEIRQLCDAYLAKPVRRGKLLHALLPFLSHELIVPPVSSTP